MPINASLFAWWTRAGLISADIRYYAWIRMWGLSTSWDAFYDDSIMFNRPALSGSRCRFLNGIRCHRTCWPENGLGVERKRATKKERVLETSMIRSTAAWESPTFPLLPSPFRSTNSFTTQQDLLRDKPCSYYIFFPHHRIDILFFCSTANRSLKPWVGIPGPCQWDQRWWWWLITAASAPLNCPDLVKLFRPPYHPLLCWRVWLSSGSLITYVGSLSPRRKRSLQTLH